jgi:hypothetical protein
VTLKIDHYVPAYNEQHNANITSQVIRDAMYCRDAGHTYRFRGAHGCDLISMRNRALHRSLTEGFDYLFMQDSDVFSPAADGPLKALLGTAIDTGATLTGAAVTMRTRPARANVWPCHVGEVFEADKIGSGMILLDLNKMRGWYDAYDGPCFQRMYENDKCIEPKVGSDIFFCYVVRQHGGRIVCDATVPTVHKDATHGHAYDGESIPEAAGQSVEAIGGLQTQEVANG